MTPQGLVTGATGLLGSHIVERLVAEGWRVRALVRNPVSGRWLQRLGATIIPGDIADPASLHRAAEGCAAVFHTAAAVGSRGDWEHFSQGNIGGTANVLAAARQAGARLVQISSTAVYGEARYSLAPADESQCLPQLPAHDHYGRSKQEAERIVLEAHAAGKVWGTIVRPPMMYGERDRQLAPRIAPVLSRGLFPLINGGRTTLPLVHASAVADGALRAAATDVAGGRAYNLTNDTEITVAMFVQLAARGIGCRVRTPALSAIPASLGFHAVELYLRIRRPDLAHHVAGMLLTLSRDNPFDSTRARTELNWCPSVDPRVALPDAFRWWRERYLGNQPRPIRVPS